MDCHIHDTCANSLSYTDDKVLMTPTAEALQEVNNKCCTFSTDHDIIYNTSKIECVIVPSENSKVSHVRSAKLTYLRGALCTWDMWCLWTGQMIKIG